MLSDNSHQLEAVQAPSHPPSHSRLLFIGDSISCGYSPEPMLVPRGSLDAFTSRTAAHLGLPYDIVAYPGITLEDPDPAGTSLVRCDPGMVSRFFLVRPGHPYVPPLLSVSDCETESRRHFRIM